MATNSPISQFQRYMRALAMNWRRQAYLCRALSEDVYRSPADSIYVIIRVLALAEYFCDKIITLYYPYIKGCGVETLYGCRT